MTIKHEASSGYAVGRLQRALNTARTHEDAQVRARALAKVDKWTAVLEGIAGGTLSVGSRTPVADTEAWVTLEVAHGGFATGRYLAEGPLREHEVATLQALPDDTPGSTDRERLNAYFLGDEGQEKLRRALVDGRFEVDVPEEAALVVVTWLLEEGHDARALDLIARLRPMMHRLRFYPRLTERARSSNPGVHVSTAGAIAESFRGARANTRVVAMNTTLKVWNPLYDALVQLWLKTVDGPPPTLARDEDGQLLRDAKGQPVAKGGEPCRVWPAQWSAERDLWLARYGAALRRHDAKGRHHKPKSNFQVLRRYLERCPADRSKLSDASVAAIRHAIACAVHKHGVPGEAASAQRRAEQARIAALPLFADIAHVLAQRLAKLPKNEGISSLDLVAAAVAEDEHPNIAAGVAVPSAFVRKAARALVAPVDELVERGVIRSAEVLAIVLPQITSQVQAAGIEDPQCRDLYAKTYAAFRRRRSLLLLNLEHQVSVDELPWVEALAPFRRSDLGVERLARQTLRDVTVLALEHFGHTILPNPLLREMNALARQARIDVPLVEEIAADIFMGTFTKKFSDASNIARECLAGTLYARYYDLPAAATSGRLRKRWGKTVDEGFDALCSKRAKEAGSEGGRVAQNGAVLEQMQILTSYNLAPLVMALDLQPLLERRGADFAEQALRWVFDRHVAFPSEHYPRLRAVKNSAYAWRQAIFFLSFVDTQVQRAVLERVAAAHSNETRSYAALARLTPAIAGLRHVIEGGRFDERGRARTTPKGRRFLGWSCGTHWMLAK